VNCAIISSLFITTDYVGRNRALLEENISVILTSLIGPITEGDHKIGKSRFHVLYGFRDEGDVLKSGWFVMNSG
jgi:hypothetical protein